MPDIHMLYRIALEAALAAELISLRARRDSSKQLILNDSMQMETRLLNAQIEAIEAEIEHLNR